MAGRVEQIDIHADAITSGYLLVVLRPTDSISPVLQITSLRRQGYLLELRDPYGSRVWAAALNAKNAIDPEFGVEFMKDGD